MKFGWCRRAHPARIRAGQQGGSPGAGPRIQDLSLCGRGAQGTRLLCTPRKVEALVLGHGDVHARTQSAAAGSLVCVDSYEDDRRLDLGRDSGAR